LIAFYVAASKGAVTFLKFVKLHMHAKSPLTIVSNVWSTAHRGITFKQLSVGQIQPIPVTNLVK